jgi:hypothetical protein
MYDENYNAQKAQLDQNYQQGVSDLEQQQQKAQKQTDANLNRTYVESQKAAKNYDEVQNAYGLTSGAMAQAKLAQNNQLQSDLTAIRAAQQNVDADVEREKGLLSQQYAAAIAKARAENNMEMAQALYQQAKEDDAALLQRQKEAANLMAGVGDYSLIAQLYGLTDAQLKRLQGGGRSSGGGGGSGLSLEKQAEMGTYVQNMLNGASGSRFDPSRVISGNNNLSDAEKEYAQAYLDAMLNAGYMK